MIKVQNLTRTFGDFKAVDDISFETARTSAHRWTCWCCWASVRR
jgi:ABC-type branched-subunit amino acid transport system ATPase component